jgi:hypothetical protein
LAVTGGLVSPKRRFVKRSLYALLLLLGACQGEPPPDLNQAAAGPPPAELCAEIAKSRKDLDAQPGIEYDEKGEATIAGNAWTAMSPDNHADFARSLAFIAACASGRQSEAQPVRIRNESGRILLETTVTTKVDLRSMLKK